jgi:uncharacterized protein YjbI with pentapeptide repeats
MLARRLDTCNYSTSAGGDDAVADAKKIDPFDVEALEKSLNDSATRVSTIWISYLLFGLYLVIATGNVTHRQLLLEEPIKLPVLNVDLPLVGFFFLTPILFVAIHTYVLIQAVLLSRTAAAYNEALAKSNFMDSAEARVRQRLANTLFAQLFAGSPREREGLLGWLLSLIAWATLAIAPVLVLFTFELKFLPFHSVQATWGHRGLIVLDLIVVLLLWPGILDSQKDIAWRTLLHHWKSSLLIACLVLFSVMALTFPGEQHATLVNSWVMGRVDSPGSTSQCRKPRFLLSILPSNFDRLFLSRETFADASSQPRTRAEAGTNQTPEGKKPLKLREKDLFCAIFDGADLTQADFTGARLVGATFVRTELQGAIFDGATLRDVSFREARLQKSSFQQTQLDNVNIRQARLDNANFDGSRFNNVDLTQADFRGAKLTQTDLRGATLSVTVFQDADLSGANLENAKMNGSRLQGANLSGAQLRGADLSRAEFQGAILRDAKLHGANLNQAVFNGANLAGVQLQGAGLREVKLQGALLDFANLRGSDLTEAAMQGASMRSTDLQGTFLDKAEFAFAGISGVYVWGASGDFKCEEAATKNLQFELAIETGYSRFAERLLSIMIPGLKFPTVPTSASIGDFLESIVKDVPQGSQEKLRESLGKRLLPVVKVLEAADKNNKAWLACSTRVEPREDYARRKATYFAKLVCATTVHQKYIASGIYRNVVGKSSVVDVGVLDTAHFAQSVILANGKFCPGAEELDEKTKDQLREIAGKGPPK